MPRPRNLGLILGGLAITALVGWVLTSRAAARTELERILQAHAEEGLGTTLEDLVDGLPAVDPDLQKRVWEWMDRPSAADAPAHTNHDSRWYLEGREAPDEQERIWIERFAPEGNRFGELLDTGRVVLTSAGWLAADADRLAATPVGSRILRLPHHVRFAEASCWLEARALLERGRGSALDRLDRLRKASAPAACFLDGLVGWRLAEVRDRTYLLLAMRGDLSDERLLAWVDEPSDAADTAADGLRGERLLSTAPLAHALLEGRSLLGEFESGEAKGLQRLERFWDREVLGPLRWPGDCARLLAYEAALERHLRRGGAATAAECCVRARTKAGWPFDLMTPWGDFDLCVAWRRTVHRSVRVAGLLVAATRGEAGLPTTPAEVRGRLGSRARLLDAGDQDFGLTVRTFGPDRFRVTVDPDAPVPPLVRPDDPWLGGLTPEGALGRPPSTAKLEIWDGSVEVAVR